MITNATYAGSNNTIVRIEPDNKNVKLDYPELVSWVGAGGIINPYIQNIAQALKDAQNLKTIEINAYAKTLVENAYANPTIEQVDIDPVLHRNEMSLRRNNKADKLAGEKVLTQDEKDEAKIDQKLSEFEYKISQDRNKAVTNMLKLNTAAEVNAFDVSAENWNVWISPA